MYEGREKKTSIIEADFSECDNLHIFDGNPPEKG